LTPSDHGKIAAPIPIHKDTISFSLSNCFIFFSKIADGKLVKKGSDIYVYGRSETVVCHTVNIRNINTTANVKSVQLPTAFPHLNNPQWCKSRRASEPRRQGCRRSKSTANPWQRRIWSPPAFP
jgi:hypothetical protein